MKYIASCLAVFLLAPIASDAAEDLVVGVWELVSVRAIASDGSIDDAPYGPGPHGYITYTASGYMTVLFSFGDRPRIDGSWRTAPESERAEAFATVLGYAGTYSVEGTMMTHHVTVSTDPNRVGTSISRKIEFGEDSITLTTPAIDLGDTAKRYSLTWRRVETKNANLTAMPPNNSMQTDRRTAGR